MAKDNRPSGNQGSHGSNKGSAGATNAGHGMRAGSDTPQVQASTPTAVAAQPVAATAPAPTPAPAGDKPARYPQIMLGVGTAHTGTAEKMSALATKLGCRVSALFWKGAELILANPPTVAPAGAIREVGTAAGFWVVPIKNNGVFAGAEVVEVSHRTGTVTGTTFYRYSLPSEKVSANDSNKERMRARSQAVRGAQILNGLANVSGDVKITELPSAEQVSSASTSAEAA